MKLLVLVAGLLLAGVASSQTIYVVRHAEKAVPAATDEMHKRDPALSEDGQARAAALLALFLEEKVTISQVYSTPYKRTRSTVEPVRAKFNLVTVDYSSLKDSAISAAIRAGKGNILIAGHSNTVDDIVNEITGTKELSDLPDSEYDNLYVLVRENGKWVLQKRKYGNVSL